MSIPSYREPSEVDSSYDDVDVKKKESPLFRVALLAAFIAGPVTITALGLGLAHFHFEVLCASFAAWSLISYVIMFCIWTEPHTDFKISSWRKRLMCCMWSPIVILSYVAWRVARMFSTTARWIVAGETSTSDDDDE